MGIYKYIAFFLFINMSIQILAGAQLIVQNNETLSLLCSSNVLSFQPNSTFVFSDPESGESDDVQFTFTESNIISNFSELVTFISTPSFRACLAPCVSVPLVAALPDTGVGAEYIITSHAQDTQDTQDAADAQAEKNAEFAYVSSQISSRKSAAADDYSEAQTALSAAKTALSAAKTALTTAKTAATATDTALRFATEAQDKATEAQDKANEAENNATKAINESEFANELAKGFERCQTMSDQARLYLTELNKIEDDAIQLSYTDAKAVFTAAADVLTDANFVKATILSAASIEQMKSDNKRSLADAVETT